MIIEIRAKRTGKPAYNTIQIQVCFNYSGVMLHRGSPVTRIIIMPETMPKLIVIPNDFSFSGGTVSARIKLAQVTNTLVAKP